MIRFFVLLFCCISVVVPQSVWRDEKWGTWSRACDFPGKLIEEFNARPTECANLCIKSKRCTNFLWIDDENGRCWLKTGPATQKNVIPLKERPNLICAYINLQIQVKKLLTIQKVQNMRPEDIENYMPRFLILEFVEPKPGNQAPATAEAPATAAAPPSSPPVVTPAPEPEVNQKAPNPIVNSIPRFKPFVTDFGNYDYLVGKTDLPRFYD